jgi:hypothetical protein
LWDGWLAGWLLLLLLLLLSLANNITIIIHQQWFFIITSYQNLSALQQLQNAKCPMHN